MVKNVMNLSRNGLSDWVIQRVSAVILGIYFVGLLGFMVMTPDLGYAEWHALFSTTWMRIASLLIFIYLVWGIQILWGL